MKHFNPIFIVLIFVIFGLMCLMGYFALFPNDVSAKEELELKSSELAQTQNSLNQANLKIIELQENEKYINEQLRKAKLDLNKTQEVYSKLWGDAVNCFYANFCLYYPADCLNSIGDIWEGYTVEQIHRINSDSCDDMTRDWSLYQSYDVEITK